MFLSFYHFQNMLTEMIVFFILLTTIVQVNTSLTLQPGWFPVEELEYNEVKVIVQREGDSSFNDVLFRCELSSNSSLDFINNFAIGQLKRGETITNCTFVINNDIIPEIEENYPVSLHLLLGNATVQNNNQTFITIRASDDPFGCIGFSPAANVITTKEPLDHGGQKVVNFQVIRYGGLLGNLMVYWKILQSTHDIAPTDGMLNFLEGDKNVSIVIKVLPDQIPESLEIFSIVLKNISGGACMLSNASEAELRVEENDAPVQFLDSEATVHEATTLKIVVLRGLYLNGKRIGPISEPACIFYRTVPKTAQPNVDYEHIDNGELVFDKGSTQKEISLKVLSDPLPELKEMFSVVLYNPCDDVILINTTEFSVSISKNDDAHGVVGFQNGDNVFIVHEDNSASVSIAVNRSRGTFGDVYVEWCIEGANATEYFHNASGTEKFSTGENLRFVTLRLYTNHVPQEAIMFALVLKNVTGGARFRSTKAPSVKIVVADSDNAYGSISFSKDSPNLVLSTTPRTLQLNLTRHGGALANICVLFSAHYFSHGSPTSGLLNQRGKVEFKTGQTQKTLMVEMQNDMFLKTGSSIFVRLESVNITKKTVYPPSSPSLISPDICKFNITSDLANSEIAFYNIPVSLAVSENTSITLPLMRDGTALDVTVFWRLIPESSTFDSWDVDYMNGSVLFPAGSEVINITFMVLADGTPELNEDFRVELLSVDGRNERLRGGATTARVRILSNNVPGGTIEFADTRPIELSEASLTELKIIRKGGTLITQRALLQVMHGELEFAPYRQVVTFLPGVSSVKAYLVPKDDDVPELSRMFVVCLESISQSKLGPSNSLNVTLLASDDPHGLVSFADYKGNLQQTTKEGRDTVNSLMFILTRSKGRFGNLEVFWDVKVTNNASDDIYPGSGSVVILEGKNTASIQIFVKQDELPELDELFYMKLTNISGGAQIISPLHATLTITANDFPVTIWPGNVGLNEGESVKLTVCLSHPLSETVYVNVQSIIRGRVSTSDLNVVNRTITFAPFTTQQGFFVESLNDDEPETDETFQVQLVSSTGDTVLFNDISTNITIFANDDPYGVFVISEAKNFTVEEGDAVHVNVHRHHGLFEQVNVYWDTFWLDAKDSHDSEISPSFGSIMFIEGQTVGQLTVNIVKDGLPEVDEIFAVHLINITGRKAQMGANITAHITILSNDHPNGVFEVNRESSLKTLAEDPKDSPQSGKVVFQRRFGSFYSAKVIWSVFPSTLNPSIEITDMLLHAQNVTNIKLVGGRPHTATQAYLFDKGQCLDIDYSFPYSEGFTIGLWLKTNATSTMMSILKKTNAKGIIDYELSVNVSAILIGNEKNNNVLRLNDGAWHSLFVAAKLLSFVMYIDGNKIGDSFIGGSSILPDDVITIACGSFQPYSGTIQDARLYSSFLAPNEIASYSSTHDSITPSTGELVFGIGETRKEVVVHGIDDELPEAETVYTVRLIDVKDYVKQRDRAIINATSNDILVNVLKSDFANGIFSIHNESCSQQLPEQLSQGWNITISRAHGFFGSVSIDWFIRDLNEELVTGDFVFVNGTVEFNENVIEKVFFVQIQDDHTPELDETFYLQIDVSSSQKELVKDFAMVNKSSSQCKITILSNDHPFGLFQVMSAVPDNVPYITLLLTPMNVSVDEEGGLLHLFIARALGTEGTTSVSWVTNDLSAIAGVDYVGNNGTLTFADGIHSKKISITLIDNSIPELSKDFQVILTNTSGNGELGNASVMNINILHSDNSLGVFSFKTKFLSVNEGNNGSIHVKRIGGALGGVLMSWCVQNTSDEVVPNSGQLYFDVGVKLMTFSVFVKNDIIPELCHTLTLEIYNVSGGSIDVTNNTTSLSIPQNDHPFGLFEMMQKSIEIEESQKKARFYIQRRKGLFGSVQVEFNAEENSVGDFRLDSGFVVFNEGQVNASVSVQIFDNTIPELTESFTVNLTAAQLLPINNVTNDSNESLIGPLHSLIISIVDNDYAHGIVEFEVSHVSVTEKQKSRFLNLVRSKGLFGEVLLSFGIANINAYLGADFFVTSFDVIFRENENETQLSLFITDDDVPEFNETFVVYLLPGTSKGGLVVGNQSSCQVMILENDFPQGLIGFTSIQPIVVTEPSLLEKKRIALSVERLFGSYGPVQMQWEALPVQPWFESNDISPSQGFVVFLDGESTQNIVLDIMPDDYPEINEIFIVSLKTVTLSKAVLDSERSSVNITILLNDNPYGTVEFNENVLHVTEKTIDSPMTLFLSRVNGVFGDLQVFYSTQDLQSVENHALADTDYKQIIDDSFFISNGSSQAEVLISILHDTIPELDETFQVVLTKVKVLDREVEAANKPVIGKNSYINVTIQKNDDPYGLFMLSLDGYPRTNDKQHLIEPDEKPLPLLFHVERRQGTYGAATVSWKIETHTMSLQEDFSAADGFTLIFKEGEQKKSFIIQLNNDSVAETSEEFSVVLYNAHKGRIQPEFNGIHFFVEANDNVGGIIGFKTGSLSVSVKEGETFSLTLERSSPAFGLVTVEWYISGGKVEKEFNVIKGVVQLSSGQLVSSIQLTCVKDDLPEIDKSFFVHLTSIKTNISSYGAAILSETSSISSITVAASDHPHGIVQFASTNVSINENYAFKFLMIRRFGKIGDLNLTLEIKDVSLNSTHSVSVEQDIGIHNLTVKFPHQFDSIVVSIPIINDDVPELDEEFLVEIASVNLTSNISTHTPSIGANRILRVKICANDGARGVLSFAAHSMNYVVAEADTSFNLTILRSLGSFGEVYCFYFLNRLTAGSNDFAVEDGKLLSGPVKLIFKDGQHESNITVHIFDDNETEDDEIFEIGITTQNAINNGGVEIGIPNRTKVKILQNDDSNGVFNFDSQSHNITLREGGKPNFITVLRHKGLFGRVELSWSFVNTTSPLGVSPLSGVLAFVEHQKRATFQVSALDDDYPELETILFIQLELISGGARLGPNSKAAVVIPANDDPHGIFTFSSYQKLVAEESAWPLKVSVYRQGGSYGNTSVYLKTSSFTAISQKGNKVFFGVVFAKDYKHVVYHFKAFGEDYIILYNENATNLFVWRGALKYIQDFDIKDIVEIESAVIGDQFYLITRSLSFIKIFLLNHTLGLLEVEIIAEHGISDMVVFDTLGVLTIVFAIEKGRKGESINRLQVYTYTNGRLSQHTSVHQTFQATSIDVAVYQNSTYLAVGNSFNRLTNSFTTKSFVYQWDTQNRGFKGYAELVTDNAKEIRFFKNVVGELFLGIANEKCQLYKHNYLARFHLVQEFPQSCSSMLHFQHKDRDYLILLGNKTSLNMWSTADNHYVFQSVLHYSNIVQITAMELAGVPHLSLMFPDHTDILRMSYANTTTTDFVPWENRLFFNEGESKLDIFISILQDGIPELNETFSLELYNPTGGSKISTKLSQIWIWIPPNGHPYGRIKVADFSLNITVEEKNHDSAFSIELVREDGTHNNVIVFFNLTDDHDNLQNEIYPDNGQVKFFAGERNKSLSLYLRGDDVPELMERVIFSLTSVSTSGTLDGNSGARIKLAQNTAMVNILPNDHPYGIFAWENQLQIVTESQKVNSSALLMVKRNQGTFGEVVVSYQTVTVSVTRPHEMPAIPFIDFTPVVGNVTFKRGQQKALVYIPVNHKLMELHGNTSSTDGNVTFNEIFYVNLTQACAPFTLLCNLVSPKHSLTRVVITEVLQKHGVIEFRSASSYEVYEDVGVLEIPLLRYKGTNGIVGVVFQIIFNSASYSDVQPDNGTIVFNEQESNAYLPINIIDDSIPEFTESFYVVLNQPIGGAELGLKREILIQIKQNDYPFGLFSVHPSSREISAKEGDSLFVKIERLFGANRSVDISWRCYGNGMVIETSGVVTFKESETLKSITLSIIDDEKPNLQKRFMCQLLSVTNNAELTNQTNFFVTVKASDKPRGVYSINSHTHIVVLSEPEDGHANKNISIVREAGQEISSSISWVITSTTSAVSETFFEISGKVQFNKGVKEKLINLQVMEDNSAEEAEQFTLTLHSPTNGSELSNEENSTQSFITVKASDHPYGLFSFLHKKPLYVAEDIGVINVAVIRSGGLIGQVDVCYVIVNGVDDVQPYSGVARFSQGESVQIIRIHVINDSTPELMENYTLTLTSIRLNSTVDVTTEIGNVSIHQPPLIMQCCLVIVVVENDDAYGLIEFLEPHIFVNEMQSVLEVAVVRRGGHYGNAMINYGYSPMSATQNEDFLIKLSSVVFQAHQNISFINVSIIDDEVPEDREEFQLNLLSVIGRARIGKQDKILVTIETNDNVNGLFGLYDLPQTTAIENPEVDTVVRFNVSRQDGVSGTIRVDWSIKRSGMDTDSVLIDLTPSSGFIIFADRQRGSLSIDITVLNYQGSEEKEEKFLLALVNVSVGARIDASASIKEIIVKKKGHPSGLFSINVRSLTTTELFGEMNQIRIPVLRRHGVSGNVTVFWDITPISTNSQFDDLAYFHPQELHFLEGRFLEYIFINITDDLIPELNEIFKFELVRVMEPGDLDWSKRSMELNIRANDNPHGVFKLSAAKVFINVSNHGRNIQFTVERSAGMFGQVKCIVALEHEDVPRELIEIDFHLGVKKLSTVHELEKNVFIRYPSQLNVIIVNATLLSAGDSFPAIHSQGSFLQVNLEEAFCNSLVDLTPFVLSDGDQVAIPIIRTGLYGSISVTVSNTIKKIQMVNISHRVRTATVVLPVLLLTSGVHEANVIELKPKRFNLGWPDYGPIRRSIVDPHGVFCASSSTLTVIEGTRVIVVLRRFMNSIGKVRIYYNTKEEKIGAKSGEDFVYISSFVDFSDGDTEKIVVLNTIDNTQAEPLEKFSFQLLNATLLTNSLISGSPRFCAQNNTVVVTITDDDYPYGVFVLSSQYIQVEESEELHVEVLREFGSFSEATVDVMTVAGGELWSDNVIMNSPVELQNKINAIMKRAVVNRDYGLVNKNLLFPKTNSIVTNGQSANFRIQILSDLFPEPTEKFLIVLQNPSAGAAISPTRFYTVVSIKANGLYNGQVGFEKMWDVVDEDAMSGLRVYISREGDALQNVKIDWIALQPFTGKPFKHLQQSSGSITIPAGQKRGYVELIMVDDDIPELASWFWMNLTSVSTGGYIRERDSAMNISVTESDTPAGLLMFHPNSRYVVVTKNDLGVSLTIERCNGTLKEISVEYSTTVLKNSAQENGVTFYPAVSGRDFDRTVGTIKMAVGQNSATFLLQLTPGLSNSNLYPRIFNVTLQNPTQGASIDPTFANAQVAISQKESTARFLKLRSSLLSQPQSDAELETILQNLLSAVKSLTLSEGEQQIILGTIGQILTYKTSKLLGLRRLNTRSINYLLELYNVLMDEKRSDTKGKYYWVNSLEFAAYCFLDDTICPTTLHFSQPNFDLKVITNNGSDGLQFSHGSNFFRYPKMSPVSTKCLKMQFVVLKNTHLFTAKELVLENKILSSSVSQSLENSQKIIFRVYTTQARITSTNAACVVWNHVAGEWSHSGCQLKQQTKIYVDCECSHLSEYAVLARSDDRTGYELYFYVAGCLIIAACFLAILVHHFCSMEKTFSANILMHMFFAVMATNIVYLVGAYISPGLVKEQEACSVLAVFLHYFFLAQFTTMFVQACNLWRILIMNDEHSYRKSIPFFLISWGLPLFIILGYVFITYAVWDWSFNTMYADVHGNGDMCFVSHAYAAFSVAVIPVLLLTLAVGVVFVQAYQVTPQWKCYDDIYRGRYNIKEVRHLMVLFVLLSITWLFGGLHLAYGHLWMAITFTFFNVITGLDIIIVYVILRNQMRYVFKGEYQVRQPADQISLPQMYYETGEGKRMFGQHDYLDLHDWDNVDLTRMTPISNSRLSAATPLSKPQSIEPLTTPTAHYHGTISHDSSEKEFQSSEFGDLIFAMNSGKGRASSVSNEDEANTESGGVRRILIGDTHL